ncbi:MAG: Cna B-type domain-containing protein [Oscillospiraceae bacterium]|nr:Cna B-type domain-containing protein [Oscillospiraceae bacterium]
MTKAKRFLALFFMLITLLCFSAKAFAISEKIDPERESTLEIIFREGEKNLSGAEFSVYLIANIDENGKFTVTEEFSGFNVDITGINDEAWRALAMTLESFIFQNNSVPAAKGITDSEGIARFEGLEPGLYLAIGTPISLEGYTYFAETAIFQIPSLDTEAGAWNYDVSIKPKHSSIPDGSADSFISRKVLKIWDDKGYEPLRPKEIKVYLFCDGELYDTVILSAENNWRHTWEKLEEGHKWVVSEEVPEGYTVRVTKEGITFVIENSIEKPNPPEKPRPPEKPEPPKEPDEPKLPQTGQLWWPVPVFFGTGILFVAAGILRKRGGYEK